VIGIVMFLGVGPHQSVLLTLVPALLAIATIALVCLIPRLHPGTSNGETGIRRVWVSVRRWVVTGAGDAGLILRDPHPAVLAGAIGYWAFDNAVLWATFHAIGMTPPLTVILMGYLIGQMGGLLPLPGGVGGIDGGLIGTLVVYGAPVAATAAAVLLYRVILFWLPLLCGAVAFTSLRRGIDTPDRPDLCRDPEPVLSG